MNHTLDVLQSFAVSGARFGIGTFTVGHTNQPKQMLELYEFEACPFCRKVREALSVLDLDVKIYPCPKGGEVYRKKVKEMGDKAMFPYLVDPNTGTAMYESDDIVQYLFDSYGPKNPGRLMRGPLATGTSALASVMRGRRGGKKRPSVQPEEPLELWSFESSPFSRIVRETLCELELPYVLHNVAKGSNREWVPPALREYAPFEIRPATKNREELVRRAGKVQVPFLIDPNTGRQMFESLRIQKYLNETYGR